MSSGLQKMFSHSVWALTGSVLTYIIVGDGNRIWSSSENPDLSIAEKVPPHHSKVKTKSWHYESYTPNHHWNYDWDCRHFYSNLKTEDNKPLKTKAARNIILIRHGQYNLKGATDEEKYLTELGNKQADETGRRLADLNLPLTYIVSSTMTRALQTADIIRRHLSPDLKVLEPDMMLREGGPYPPEPISRWSPEHRYHVDGARIEAVFRKYFYRAHPTQTEDSYEVIVCHANVIRYLVCRALQLPPEAWLRISLKHASLTWIAVRPDGRVFIRTLGDSGHLEPSMLTTS